MYELLGPLVLFAAVMTLTPGPNVVLVTASGANFGFARTIPQMLGITFGFGGMAVAAGFGVAGLVQAKPQVHDTLRYAGAAYLLALAWRIAHAQAGAGSARTKPIGFGEATLITWANPNAWVSVLGALAAFTTTDGNVVWQVLLISGVLARASVEAVAFPGDLTNLDGVPALVRSIEQRLGSIDVAVYQPVGHVGFVPAMELDAAKLQSMASIFMLSPIEVSHAVLPGMLARGDGAVVIVGGLTAVVPIPGMSGVGPLMAAARNYIFTLNAEVTSKGVYAGTVNIGAVIEHSAGLRVMTSSGATLDPRYPLINPDEIAQEIWTLVTTRDRVEAILPPLPQA